MPEHLLLCTDLDRTLLPNGPQPESPAARRYFAALVAHPAITLAYVSGRHRALVEQAIADYQLPLPDFVIGDVGTTIYQVGPRRAWQRLHAWEEEIAPDWGCHTHAELQQWLQGLPGLQLQEQAKQNRYKLSYYLPLQGERTALLAEIRQRLDTHGVKARLIWSVDEPRGLGLLDVLPARASKYHALETLMRLQGFDCDHTIFCGDSGNDIEVLASPIPAVLVANAQPEVRQLALRLATEAGLGERLYIAHGGFMGMNGYYSAGMLEGIAHYYPQLREWMGVAPRTPGEEGR
ncbi:MAG: HAD-IIB family hydrolase [Gammaproteobacteria bacterium]|nr:HAD-IIB family hydrolase [Gammaproteobacteria bacterium]